MNQVEVHALQTIVPDFGRALRPQNVNVDTPFAFTSLRAKISFSVLHRARKYLQNQTMV